MKVEETFVEHGPLWSTGVTPDPAAPAAPSRAPLPVRWTSSEAGEAQGDLGGGESDVAGEGDGAGQQLLPGEPEPDAVAKGWVVPPGGSRVDAIFVLAGTSLGIGRVERATSPVWLNLDDLVNLDAVGDPVDGLTEVEILMDDHRIIGAGWPDHFCEAVVQVLVDSAGRATATPGSPADTSHGSGQHSGAVAEPQVAGAARDDIAAPEPELGAVPSPFSAAQVHIEEVPQLDAEQGVADTFPGTSPAPDATPAAALELEDVVYLGGYPGQSKRRKKCVAGMSRAALELSGPGDLNFRVGWDVVRTIEVQNADEARFRMNTKIHRDASALVIECDQGVTILLEARDCPTIALRSAISQLLDGLPVVVV